MDRDLLRMQNTVDEMRRRAKELRDEVDAMNRSLGWGDWEPHTVGIIPIRLNGRWYWKGDTIYRRQRMWGLTGGSQYKYGDEFDVLKELNDNI
jgi:hypothetical protein